MTNVPYYALSAELTEDYDEPSRQTTVRVVLAVPACIIGAALTPVLVGLFASKRAGYGMVDVVYGSLATAALWIYAAGIKERKKIDQSIS